MKKSTKLICILCVLTLIFSLVFTACGDTTSPEDTDENTETQSTEDSGSKTAMKLDSITVTKNMMSYFFRTEYIHLINTYADYFGYGNPYSLLGIDPDKSLSKQTYFTGEQSWYDYLLEETVDKVSQHLIYAAYANDNGITLSDEDKADVEASLNDIILEIRTVTGKQESVLDDDACCKTAFGSTVKKSDVRKALEFKALAQKAAKTVSVQIKNSVSDDSDRITTIYQENPKLFNYVDYLTFTFEVEFEDVAADKYPDKDVDDLTDDEKAEVIQLCKKKIEEVRKNAKELESKTNSADYIKFITEYIINENYNSVFDFVMSHLTSTEYPTDEELKTIKDNLSAEIISEITTGKTEPVPANVTVKTDALNGSEETYYVYDINVNKNFAEEIDALKARLFSTVYEEIDTCNAKRTTYEEPENDGELTSNTWAFDAERKEFDVKTFEIGDTNLDAIGNNTDVYFFSEVVMITKPAYKIETLSRDFAYLLYETEEDAKTAIEAINKIEGLNKDKFLALASDESNPAYSYQFIEDYVIYSDISKIEGLNQVNFSASVSNGNNPIYTATYSSISGAIDNWLFDDNTKEGSYTKEPILTNGESYIVLLYVSQGNTPEWKSSVINHLAEEDSVTFEKNLYEKLEKKITSYSSVLAKLEDKGYQY